MAAPININANLNLNSASINASAKQVQQALGRITGQASEFQKSLDASTARVFAFGATTAVINGVTQSFKALVSTTVNVQAKLTEINSILGAGAKEFNQYRNSIFNVAKQTGQSFDTVAGGAAELARQGLGAEESAKRLKAALILTRISGLGAEQSVKALTAAMNGFTSAGLTAEQIVNKIVAVDTAFAVSAQDLADGFSRAGSTAEDAGVKFEELLALITAVEQRTARGGAVIGNAFKSIFTRISRGSTIDQLKELGVAINANQTGIQKLKALSQALENISDPTIASEIKELAGGVFQINVVSSTLKDLSSETSVFGKATKTAFSEGNAAMEKNAFLQEDLLAKLNVLTVTVTSLGERLGNLTIGPALKSLLSLGTSLAEGIDKALVPDKGNKFVQGLFSIIGKFISGPGLAIFSVAFFKIFKMVLKFAKDGFKSLMQMGSAAEKVKNIEGGIVDLLQRDLGLRKKLENSSLTQAQKEKAVLDAIKQQNTLLKAQQQIVTNIAAVARKGGVTGFSSTTGSFRGKKGRRFAAGGEGQMEPDLMTALVNESRDAPRGASPFVTNFRGKPAVMNTAEAQVKIGGREEILTQDQIPRFNQGTRGVQSKGKYAFLVPQIGARGILPSSTVKGKKFAGGAAVRGPQKNKIQGASDTSEANLEGKIQKNLFSSAAKWTQKLMPLGRKASYNDVQRGFKGVAGAKGALKSAVGSAFEVGITKSLDYHAAGRENAGDFDIRGGANISRIQELFGIKERIADFKASQSRGNISSFYSKVGRENAANKEGKQTKAQSNAVALKRAEERDRRKNPQFYTGSGKLKNTSGAMLARSTRMAGSLRRFKNIQNYAKGSTSKSKLFGGGMKKRDRKRKVSIDVRKNRFKNSRLGQGINSMKSQGGLAGGFALSAVSTGLDSFTKSSKEAAKELREMGQSARASSMDFKAGLSQASSGTVNMAATGAMAFGKKGAIGGAAIGTIMSMMDSNKKILAAMKAEKEFEKPSSNFAVLKELERRTPNFMNANVASADPKATRQFVGFGQLQNSFDKAVKDTGIAALDFMSTLNVAREQLKSSDKKDQKQGRSTFHGVAMLMERIAGDKDLQSDMINLKQMRGQQLGEEGVAGRFQKSMVAKAKSMEQRDFVTSKLSNQTSGRFSDIFQGRQDVASGIVETGAAFSEVKKIEDAIEAQPNLAGPLAEALKEAQESFKDSVLKTGTTLAKRRLDISNRLVENEKKRLALSSQITSDRVSSISSGVKEGAIDLDLITEFKDKFKNLTSDEDRATLITDYQDQVSSQGSTQAMKDQLLKMAGIGVKGGTVNPEDLARIQFNTRYEGGTPEMRKEVMASGAAGQAQKEIGVLDDISESLKIEKENIKGKLQKFALAFDIKDDPDLLSNVLEISESLNNVGANFKKLEEVSKKLSDVGSSVLDQAKGTNDLIIKNKEDRDVIAARVTEKMAGIKDMINKITGGLDEIGF
jgi:TP901 family phage tail tape measure protein